MRDANSDELPITAARGRDGGLILETEERRVLRTRDARDGIHHNYNLHIREAAEGGPTTCFCVALPMIKISSPFPRNVPLPDDTTLPEEELGGIS